MGAASATRTKRNASRRGPCSVRGRCGQRSHRGERSRLPPSRQRRRLASWSGGAHPFRREPTGGGGAAGVDHDEAGAVVQPPEHVVEENGMGLAGVGAPQHDEVGVLHLGVAAGPAPCSEDCRQTGDGRSVSGAVTGVDVVATEGHPHELLGHEVHLVGGLRAGEHAHRGGPAGVDRPPEAGRRPVEGLLPRRRS